MSDATAGEEFREEAENRSDLGNGSVVDKRESSEGGGKRDSGASSGSEGSHQHSTQAPQGHAQGQGNRGHSQPSEEPSVDHGKINVTRHVEASPQGRYLRFEDKLGTGQYKVVYRSYDTSMGIEVAWNTVNIKNLPKEEKRRIMNEVRLLKDLEHKNLVQFHGSWVNREKEEVVFVTEIMQSGSLMDFIRKVEMIRWRVVKRWARQILRGVNYLHYQDPPIIHRDLKCDNIFINGAAGDIRIGDLGLSTSNTRSEKTMSVLGTPEFMAPELYEEFYTEKVDIYAFGMCMLEMVTKERPYSECVNAAQIYRKVTSRVPPSALDRVQNVRAREFIRVCLSPDPDKRPSAMELLDQPFLKDKNEDEDNTLVILDPLVTLAEGHAPDPSIAPPLVSGKGELAKMDPQLPGVSHPAQKGAPDLSTIAEAPTSSGSHGATPQAPINTSTGTGPPTAGGSQGQSARLPSVRAGSSASSGQSEAANSSLGESSAASAGDAPTKRRPSSNPAPMPDSGGNKLGGLGNEGWDYPEAGGEKASQPDMSKHQTTHGKTEGGEAMVDPEGAQFGAYKIPGNPPYESEDEEERDTDAGNQEGFLRGMPEDESAMPLLKLPEGRVRRSADDDDEEDDEAVSEVSSGDDHGYAPPGVTAPSSTHSPPHSCVDAHYAPVEYTISAAYGPGAPSVMPPPHPANIAAELFVPFLSASRPLATSTTTAGPPTGGPAMQAPRPPTMAAPSSAAPTVPAPRTPTSIAPKKPSTQPQQTSTNSTLASTQVFRPNALASSPGAMMTPAPRPASSAPIAVAPLMQAPRAPSGNTPASSASLKTAPQALRPWSIASPFSAAPSMQAPRPPPTASVLSGAPSMQAPWPPPASAPQAVAPTISAPRPPIAESPISHSSGGHRHSFSVPNTEGSTLRMMRGASTPGMVSPPPPRSMFQSGSRLVSSTFHAVRGLVAPDQMSASSMAALGSDPGFATPPVGPAIALQRARSFSPVDHVSHEPLTAASEGFPAFPSAPTAPAPSFPAPKPPGKSLDSKDLDARVHRHSIGDVPGSVNGAALGAPTVFGRGDRQPAAPQQGDQEAQESLAGGMVAPCWVSTEIKIANLQGPEREIMKLVMHAYIDGRMKEVEFIFNLEEDHPDQVSSEMIHDLGLSYEEHERISTMIKNLAEKARKRRIRRPSMTSSVNVGQGSHGATAFGSSGGEYPASGGAEGADNDAISKLPSGFEESSDDEVDIEEDAEYRRSKLQHDKRRRMAEKVYEARLAALLTARNDRTDEHKRAQERYRKECDDFDKKVEKLQNEKERRMKECLYELQGLEDGYRQRHRDAKHAKRHGTTGNISAQMATLSVSQSPVDTAPTPSSYAQLRTVGHGPGQNHGQSFSESGAPHGGRGHQGQLTDAGLDDPRLLSDHQAINFSQFHSNDGQMGASWSGNLREAVVAPASSTPLPQHHHQVHQHHQMHQQQHHHQGANVPPKTEEQEQMGRDRLSTL